MCQNWRTTTIFVIVFCRLASDPVSDSAAVFLYSASNAAYLEVDADTIRTRGDGRTNAHRLILRNSREGKRNVEYGDEVLLVAQP